MTFDLDLYLQGYLAVTLPTSQILLICGTSTTHGGDDVWCTISRSKVKVTQIICSWGGGILVGHWSTISSCFSLDTHDMNIYKNSCTFPRCIACKGARYPPTLPRPVMTIIQFQLPLCEGSTEKGQLEVRMEKLLNGEAICVWISRITGVSSIPMYLQVCTKETKAHCWHTFVLTHQFYHLPQMWFHKTRSLIFQESYWRSLLLSNHLSFLSSEGYEIDETAQSRSLMAQQEVLMKMFAVSQDAKM